jgi:two-component system phosphate regulon sensor histidine kinase PhoR
MHTATRRLMIIILTIVLLPLIFYVTYEISTLNEEEEMIREIYNRQLESVLFSINQYSNDIMTDFTRSTEYWLNFEDTGPLQEYLDVYPVPVIVSYMEEETGRSVIVSNQYSNLDSFIQYRDSVFENGQGTYLRLRRYLNNGYQKIEPAGLTTIDNQLFSVLTYVARPDSSWANGMIFINPSNFILGILSPRLQEVAGEDFLIQVRQTNGENQTLFSTDSTNITDFRSSSLWEISGYELAISLKEKSINEVVASRIRRNLVAVSLLSVVLIIGFWLILRNLNREVQLAQTKSEFVSNVSHEIRTPLALISMFAETLFLDRVPSEEKKKEYYVIITKETARLRNIVNKILNFSKIEAGKKTYHFRPVNLNHILKDVVSTYAFHFENNGFHCVEQYTDPLPEMSGDPEAIIESIINLLDNAMKYSPERKIIHVRSGSREGFVYLEVEDQGIGIEPDKKRQIFDKFYRITKGNVYEAQGTGLGLSLVKHIMDAHHGSVEIDSEPGQGSTFRLLFPINR